MKAATPKYRNQRLFRPGRQRKQQHLLEVSIRRDRERAIRVRSVSLFLMKTMLWLGLGAGLWFGGREGFRKYIWENEIFFLTDTHVRTDGTLTREQILTAAGITPEMNFFQLNLGRVRAAIEQLPQVEHVELDRGLPNKLSIDISERQPIAWLTDKPEIDPTATDRALLIDARGYVMTSRKRRQDFIHLPFISGVVLEDFAPGQKANTLEIQAALELIRLNADSTRWQIQSVDVGKGYCLVVTDRGHAHVTFGLDEIDRQLTRFYRLLDYLEPSHREIQTVNLLVERNTPVTFMDEAEAPVVAETTPKNAPEKGKAKATEPLPVKAATPIDSRPLITPFKRGDAPSKDPAPKKAPGEGVKKPFRTHG